MHVHNLVIVKLKLCLFVVQLNKCNVHVVLLLVGGGGLTSSKNQFFNQEAHLIVND